MACLVQEAITARLPLVAVISNDPFYDTAIIRHMASEAHRPHPSNGVAMDEKALVKLLVGDGKSNPHGNKVVCFVGDVKSVAWKSIYESCMDKKSTCVVMLRNNEEYQLGYHAGHLNPPEAMVFQTLQPFCEDILIPMVQKSLQGLSLSNIDAVLRLTKERDGDIKPSGIRETRKAFVGGVRGLKLVDVNQPYYKPDVAIGQWLATNAKPFKQATMSQLVPRGILFEGVAGTGKSAGAKYLAQNLHVQLVKVDIGSMLSKWSGEAEINLDIALSTLDQMSPCVALFDEIEKVISSNDEDGASKRMLAKLLWWLQERTSKVLVIMTTNRVHELPQELYRPPRTDETISLNGIPYSGADSDIYDFVQGLAEPFVEHGLKIPSVSDVRKAMKPLRYSVEDCQKVRHAHGQLLAQAEITGEFVRIIKTLNY